MSNVDLSQENARLKLSVRSLLSRIQENQRIERHFQGFEFQLLGCHRLKDVLDTLLLDAPRHFGLADVGLILVDRDFALADLLANLEIGHYHNRLQLRHSEDFALTLYRGEYQVTLGEQDALSAGRLFPNLNQLGSAALLPLVRHNQLLGSLHLASRDRQRFTQDKAVDFMHHLASVCAVCLDNSLTHEQLQRQSLFDPLTQVSNRAHFELEYARELQRAERSGKPMACLFLDLDNFKAVNDQHGHQAGDLCLKQVAATIKDELRKTDFLARYGGEEFVALLHSCDQQEAAQIAERIRQAVARLKINGRSVIRPTVSIGLSCWYPAGDRLTKLDKLAGRLLKSADEGLYEAKTRGRNQVVSKVFCQVIG